MIAEFSTPAANDQVIARLYDDNVDGQNRAADRPPDLPPAEPGRRLHQADLPAAPAGLERRSRARVKLELLVAGLDLRAQLVVAALGPGEEPRTAGADDRRPGQRRRPGADAAGEVPAAGLHAARNVRTTPRRAQPHADERLEPERQRRLHARWERPQAATALDVHAANTRTPAAAGASSPAA